METPPITVRLPREYHAVVRQVARMLKHDVSFGQELTKLLGDGAALSSGTADRLVSLERQCRSLLHRVDVLEEARLSAAALSDALVDPPARAVRGAGKGPSALPLNPRSAPAFPLEAGTLARAGEKSVSDRRAANVDLDRDINILPALGARSDRHSKQRQLAEELAQKLVPDGQGGQRRPTSLEVQHQIRELLQIDRRKAQSATRRAFEKLGKCQSLAAAPREDAGCF
jgi:hypothetical protein